MASTALNGENLHEELNKLYKEGRIPTVVRETVTQARWQAEAHPSGVFYGTPYKDLGRYNDPSFRAGICYTADYALIAVAESYGRKLQANPDTFFIGNTELDVAQLCSLKTTRQTTTIHMPRLLALLHIAADKVMGPDQSITQAITEWAANTPGLPYDGISYPSRHVADGMCTAWWLREGETDPLTTVSMSSVAEYRDTEKFNFPENWNERDITGKEILLYTLNYQLSHGS